MTEAGPRSAQAYPRPPWRMAGPAAVVVGLVPLAAARALVPAPAHVLPVLPGRAAGVVLVADYREGSTLRYGELAALVGPVAVAGRIGGWVTTMVVDDERSLRGGREMWAVPKELAAFSWSEGQRTSCAVRAADGALLARLEWTPPQWRLPLSAGSYFMGAEGGQVRRAQLRGVLRGAPTTVELEIPAASPLARLQLSSARLTLAGQVDAWAGAPRLLPAPAVQAPR